MSIGLTEKHLQTAREFVDKIHANGGLAPLDLKGFWEDQALAVGNLWDKACPQLPLGIRMGIECVFDELNVTEDWHRLYHDEEYRLELARRYNEKSEKIVGRKLLNETRQDPEMRWPPVKELNDIFESTEVWHNESYWLRPAAGNEDELKALLDRVEKRLEKLREFMLPPNWKESRDRIVRKGGKAPLYRSQRGPITFAMSIYGVENVIYLINDNPDLAARFRDLILRAMLARAEILDNEAGFDRSSAPRGFYWCDDNCAMLNADMYEFFGYPILKAVFDRYSPGPNDARGQHSDSDMAHILPMLAGLNLTSVNFGPNLTISEIRKYLPNAVIHGQLAPFTFSRNEEVNMAAELLRDFDMAREKQGVVFATAGSINNGSRLSGMRLLMAAIQQYCRYN